jgi:hypothetical protein
MTRSGKNLLLTALLVLPVPGFMLYQVLNASPMQYYDYWTMFAQLFDATGRIQPGGLLLLQNEHFVLLPRILYIVNTFLFHGSNVTLALFCLVLAGGQAVLLSRALPDRCRQDARLKALSLAAVVALTFTPQAMHNFLYSMSGAIFITANFLTVAACYALWKNRFFAAAGLGLSASATCGTGLMAWPALVFISLLRRDRFWRSLFLAGCMVLVFIAYFLLYRTKSGLATPTTDVLALARSWALTVGRILTHRSSTTRIVGYFGGAGFLWFVVGSLRAKKTADDAFWFGIGFYAAASMALIAVARTSLWEEAGFASRYATLVALFWLSLAMLLLERLGWRPATAVLVSGFLAVFLWSSYPMAVRFIAAQDEQILLAMAVRLNEDRPERLPFFNRRALPAMRAMGHYPFRGGEALDRGRMDSVIEAKETVEHPDRVRGRFEGAVMERGNRARVWGWVGSRAGAIECLLIVDRDGRVAGLAQTMGKRRGVNPEAGLDADAMDWEGYLKVRAGAGPYRALAGLKKDRRFYRLSHVAQPHGPGG